MLFWRLLVGMSHSLASQAISLVHRPLDFVGTFSNRWSYGIAFGATANKVMFLFSEGYQPLHIPQWAQGKGCLIPAGNFVMASLALRDCLAGVPWDQEINFVSSQCSPPVTCPRKMPSPPGLKAYLWGFPPVRFRAPLDLEQRLRK